MPAPILTTLATLLCPHGGQVRAQTSDTLFQVQGGYALLVNDQHPVTGCPFVLPSGTPSPCVLVRWSAGAAETKVLDVPVLLLTSVGVCYSALQAPQGPAVVVQCQALAQGA